MVVLSVVVKKTIFYNYTAIQNQVKRKGMQESLSNIGIHKEAVAWYVATLSGFLLTVQSSGSVCTLSIES